MKTPNNLSGTEKRQLVTKLEEERDKIVVDKVQNLQGRQALESKQKMARSIEQEEKKRKAKLQRALEAESGLTRLLYHLKSMWMRVPVEELYNQSLLADLSGKIRKNSRQVVLSSHNMISGKFIDKLYSSYIQANQLESILHTIFKKQKSIELYTKYAFKFLYKDVQMQRELSEIVDLSELNNMIQKGGEAAQQYVVEQRIAVRRYAKNINPSFVKGITNDINNLYSLFLFLSFSYQKFFIALGGTVESLKTGRFPDCRIIAALKPYFEAFYQFVPILGGMGSSQEVEQSIRYIFACATLVQNGGQGSESIESLAEKDEDGYVKKFLAFSQNWNLVICNYPFEDLIRLISANIYYKAKIPENPALKIKEKIKKFVELELISELEEHIKKMHDEVNADAKKNLLINYENSMLEYYSQESVVNTGRFRGVPGFGHIDEINIIYNFLTQYYMANIKKVSVHLIRNVLPKSGPLRTMVMNQGMVFDNLEERIRNFNRDLSPDKPWGKGLMNIIYRLEKSDTGNLSQQVGELMNEIDGEAEHLIQQAHKTFDDAIQQFHAILHAENPKLREALNAPIPNVPNPQSLLLAGIIEESVAAFVSIQAMIRSHYKIFSDEHK